MMEDGVKRKHVNVEDDPCQSIVPGGQETAHGQEKKTRPECGGNGSPKKVISAVLSENISVSLRGPGGKRDLWGKLNIQSIDVNVKRDNLPPVQLKSAMLEFRSVTTSAADQGLRHLVIENLTRSFQHTYVIAGDALISMMSEMQLMAAVPDDSTAWVSLLSGDDCSDVAVPIEVYMRQVAFTDVVKLEHGSQCTASKMIVTPYQWAWRGWPTHFPRLVDDADPEIMGRCELLRTNELAGRCLKPEAIYSYVSTVCMKSGEKGRYPASKEVLARELGETQHPDLQPRLRGYQERAVRWMLHQERKGKGTDAAENDTLHPLWKPFRSKSGHVVYVNIYTWKMTLHRFPAWHVSGGILADEMGLGKTVEVLATVLCNPYQPPDTRTPPPAVASGCSRAVMPATSGATFRNGIEAPSTLTPSDSSSPEPVSVNPSDDEELPLSDTGLLTPAAAVAACPSPDSGGRGGELANGAAPPGGGAGDGDCLCRDKIDEADAISKEHVFCVRCRGWQHKACVQFKDILSETQYICPQCYASRDSMPCKTTLIISPSQISGQWMEELKRHTRPGKYKCLYYTGVANGYMNPSELAKYDIIVTTYHVLTMDLSHAVLKFGQDDRPRRYRRRYIAMPSPLIGLRFWRICLDEAQMVENTNAKAAQMANRLAAEHRWCVTGTPINRGLDDLHGLLYFMEAWPYCNPHIWRHAAYLPYCNGVKAPMHDMLERIMWRTAKKDVDHELAIPDQTVYLKTLQFEPVEREYYQRQLEDCAEDLCQVIEKRKLKNVTIRSLDRFTTASLMRPLLALRQACDHPQAVRTGNWSLSLKQNQEVLSMDEVLLQLSAKASKECTEANQAQIVAVNGIAAMQAIQEQWKRSAETYASSLKLAEDRARIVATDTVLKLHATHNLLQVLKLCGDDRPVGVATDSDLSEQEGVLRTHYVQRYEDSVQSAVRNLKHEGGQAHAKQVQAYPTWFLLLLCELERVGAERYVTSKCLNAVIQDRQAYPVGFADIASLREFLCTRLEGIEVAHRNVHDALLPLLQATSAEIVMEARECHLRPHHPEDQEAVRRCRFCRCDDLLSIYESELYDRANAVPHAGGEDHAVQTWAEGPADLIIRCLHRLLRDRNVLEALVSAHLSDSISEIDERDHVELVAVKKRHEQFELIATEKDFFCKELLETAQRHVQLFEHRKKEFKLFRGLWLALCERIGSLDELQQAITRFYSVDTFEEAETDPFAVHKALVEHQTARHVAEQSTADLKYKRAVGRVLYLENLSKADNGMNEDSCPICCKVFGIQWRIYACGHCFCTDCVERMTVGKHLVNGRVDCPLCRLASQMSEIKFVTVPKFLKGYEQLKGGLSCKVAAVVRTVLELYQKNKLVKCLIFSNWNEVLNLIAHGLMSNGIKHASLQDKSGQHLQNTLKTFRDDRGTTALCLHLRTAGNGLNLIEATHVLLVEPSLKPALEMQAIGRVHRIGQTKPTFVHRFLVEGTVEERIYDLLGHQKTIHSGAMGFSPTKINVQDDEGLDLTVEQLQQVINPDLLTKGLAAVRRDQDPPLQLTID